MANFGFHELAVVAPYRPHWEEAEQAAVGADKVLEHAQETPTLAEAVAACTLVLGTGTLTYRRPEQPVVELPALGPLVAEELAQGGRIAVVFGPEKRGLTREDLSYCHRLVVIPTDDNQPSMNLGQAVAVCLYEIAARGATIHVSQSDSEAATSPADSGSLDRMAILIEETMCQAGYSPRSMQAANRRDLRLMLRRIKLNSKDARRALGLFRRVLARLSRR